MSSSFLRYCLMGGVNVGINVGVTAFMHEMVGAPEELAYCVALVTLLTVSAGNVFMAQNVPAVADAGQILTVGTPVKLLGDTSVQMIAGTAAATATIGVQIFKRGLARQGNPV